MSSSTSRIDELRYQNEKLRELCSDMYFAMLRHGLHESVGEREWDSLTARLNALGVKPCC